MTECGHFGNAALNHLNLFQHPDLRSAERCERKKGLTGSYGPFFAPLRSSRDAFARDLVSSISSSPSLLFSLFREKRSPFFARGRDPDQEHCQDDVKGVILTSRRVCPDELLFCHPVVLLYGISPKELLYA